MITSNSRFAHRVDTALMSGRGGMTNLNVSRSAGPLLDSDLQHFDATPIPAPAVRCAPRPRIAWYVRAWRACLVRFLAWKERCIADEVEGYRARGLPLGREYLRNVEAQRRDLRGRIAMLQIDI